MLNYLSHVAICQEYMATFSNIYISDELEFTSQSFSFKNDARRNLGISERIPPVMDGFLVSSVTNVLDAFCDMDARILQHFPSVYVIWTVYGTILWIRAHNMSYPTDPMSHISEAGMRSYLLIKKYLTSFRSRLSSKDLPSTTFAKHYLDIFEELEKWHKTSSYSEWDTGSSSVQQDNDFALLGT